MTIVDERGTRSLASSHRTAEQTDVLQYELDEGPCLTALQTRQVVRIDDTTTDGRWPRWNWAASLLGVRSVLSAPFDMGDEPAGAMKVYCERPLNYTAHDEHVIRLLAAQAAILLTNTESLQQARQLSRQLTDAVTSRDTSATATGVLLAHGVATRRDAFDALTAAADETARARAQLSVQDLWLRYLALGGTHDAFDVDAYLQGLSPLDAFQKDVLAQTVNEALANSYEGYQITLVAPPAPDGSAATLRLLIHRLLAEQLSGDAAGGPGGEVR